MPPAPSMRGDLIRRLIQAMPYRRRWALHYLRALAPKKPFVGRFRGGRMEVRPGEIACDAAYFFGFYERELTAWCLDLIRSGGPDNLDVVVDVGANFGYYPLLLGLESAGRIRSIAFEPDRANFEWLQHNMSLNPQLSVLCEQMCVGSTDEDQVTLRQFGLGLSGGTRVVSGKAEHRSGTGDEVVACCRLDSYLNRTGTDKVSLVLIDVEGYEGEVVEGMQAGLANHRYSRIVVELHPWAFASQALMHERVIEPFVKAGYAGYRFRHLDNLEMDKQRRTYQVDVPDREPFGPVSLEGMGGWQHFLFQLPHLPVRGLPTGKSPAAVTG